ncbi:D-lactate dehydrogenase [Rhodotorula toruloides]|uniref:D-lactate dehydrogenase (cytochrome) n=1 Tax=Rhodotorula toruloides TaxID=5286 RepID=A0A511KBV2_RHOTO|nr:D-lactate dehydrogenase [Rhodotorula toruloides]
MLTRTATPLLRSTTPRRGFASRPHPLERRATPSGPVTATPARPGLKRPVQRFSALSLVLLSTLVGSSTYAIGRLAGVSAAEEAKEDKVYREPTAEGFEKAMSEIQGWLPEDCLATDRDTLVDHGYNEWEDVVQIVKTASKHSIPLIPYCAGTSLEGHTTALGYPNNPSEKSAHDKLARDGHVSVDDLAPGLALVLDFSENMNNILAIHPEDLDAVVQPGISYDALNAELRERNIPLFFPVDPAPGAQIGGMIGTGASGTNAVRYGTMRDNVLNLTVVLPSGEVIKTRQRAKKSSVGPDLSRLFIGAEGTLGIVTEATLKLSPALPTTVAVSSFPTIASAAAAARDLVQNGISLACIELLDDVMVDATNKESKVRQWPVKPSLFLKFSGTPEQMKLDIERTRKITNSNSGSNFTFARTDKEADEIWHSRKIALWSAIEYVKGAKCWVTDVCVPLSRFPELIAETKADIEKEGIKGPIVSHAGDGNFHALLLFRTDEELKKVERLVHNMVERAQRMDGTATGEHGVGIGKKPYVENELGAGTVELLREIKRVIDPQNIMNPGKLIPDRQDAAAH